MKHANVALFVPHLGCPHACCFCNQHVISGSGGIPTARSVAETLEAARQSLGERTGSSEIAFFGGSFTAIAPGYRRELLEAARPFLGHGGFGGVRISTRPDGIDGEILAELREYGVTAIELGAQSMDAGVLDRCGRGHSPEDVCRAARLIREAGFSLGLQMMTGLPGDSDGLARETARQLADLKPVTMRIYPTLVLQGTGLARLYGAGGYRPQSLEEAVALCAELLAFFQEQGIRVIRLGLHDSPDLARDLLAGPRHPAFRELCEGKLLLDRALGQMEGLPPGRLTLAVHPGSVSKMIGQKRCNLVRLSRRGYPARVVTDSRLGPLEVVVDRE